jgi:hypothetical protein
MGAGEDVDAVDLVEGQAIDGAAQVGGGDLRRPRRAEALGGEGDAAGGGEGDCVAGDIRT